MKVQPSSPLQLPCGATLKNRLLKSAMSEAFSGTDGAATAMHARLYERWAAGGCGVLITGNVMIDGRALGEPGNVVLEDARHMDALRRWAEAGTQHGTALWMQLNHPGKQVPKGLNREAVAPSAVPFRADLQRFFATPRALTVPEVEELITRFGNAAALAQQAGFSGVQIHGAHGYLVSQFLSPHHNQRDDAWGGDAQRRRKFVLAVYRSIRERVGATFPISIKLNSADFQRGGFTEQESLETIAALAEVGIDLIEISGGTYENPEMATGANAKSSTREREAFFLDFAAKARAITSVPLAVTGGFRSTAGIEAALRSGALDVVGLGRPLVLDPELAHKVLAGQPEIVEVKRIETGIGFVDRSAMMETVWYSRQLRRIGSGLDPAPKASPLLTLAGSMAKQGLGAFRNRMRA